MSKKSLMNEATIRRWGKLAQLTPLTENWLENLTEEGEEEVEELPMGEEPAMEELPAEEPAMEELPVEEPESAEEASVEDIVGAVVQAISDVTDVEISMDAGEEMPAEEPAMEMGAEEEELPAEEPAMEMGAEEEELPANRTEDEIDADDLTEAVLRRVVKRLLAKK